MSDETPSINIIDTSDVGQVTTAIDQDTGWVTVMFGGTMIPMAPGTARVIGHQVYEAGVAATEMLIQRAVAGHEGDEDE